MRNKKILIAALVAAILIVIFAGVKLLGRHGAEYYSGDTIVLRVDGEEIKWNEYYGWLCVGKTELEAVFGEITSWSAKATEEQTYSEYMKDYTLSLIKMYKAVEANSALIGIRLSDDERAEIEKSVSSLTAVQKEKIESSYGNIDFYKYFQELSSLYKKCHDMQYGAKGEKCDDSTISDYVSLYEAVMFRGLYVNSADEAEQIAERIEKAADKYAEIGIIRKEHNINDGYDDGYVINIDTCGEETLQAIMEAESGKCVISEAGDGFWVMLRCSISRTGLMYGTGATLEEEASWAIFSSVANGWGENLKVEFLKAYRNADLKKIFA